MPSAPSSPLRIFLDRVLPEAPDVVVQAAHVAGSGPGHDDPHAKTPWFDVGSIVDRDIYFPWPWTAAFSMAVNRGVAAYGSAGGWPCTMVSMRWATPCSACGCVKI